MKKLIIYIAFIIFWVCPSYALMGAITPADGQNVNDAWLEWLLDNGATTSNIHTAEDEFLISVGYSGGSLYGRWYEFLGDLGYSGALADRVFAWKLADNVIGVDPVSDSFAFNDTGGIAFKDTGGIAYVDY